MYETIKSFAKINWVLEILSLRQDNYHNISSVFDFVDLYDKIHVKIEESNKCDINIRSNLKELEKNNILHKVVEILDYIKGGAKYKLDIFLEKNIPLKAGLGGGSSNAASLIYFLFSKKIVDLKQSIKICKETGSDVLPIFLLYLYKNYYIACFEKQNICVNIKKNLLNSFEFYLINSSIGIKTEEAYKAYDKILINKNYMIGNNTYRFIYFSKKNILDIYFPFLIYNDFEKIVYNKFSVIDEVRKTIEEEFKGKVRILLCGSGSSLISILPKDKNNKKEIWEKIKKHFPEINIRKVNYVHHL